MELTYENSLIDYNDLINGVKLGLGGFDDLQ